MFDGGNITEYEQNGAVFYIRPIEPFSSLKLVGDLQRMLSPVVGSVVAAFSSKGKGTAAEPEVILEAEAAVDTDVAQEKGFFDSDVDMAAVESVFAALAQHVDGPKLEQMCRRILDKQYIGVSIDGKKAVKLDQSQINELFTGNISGMLQLIVKVLQINYGDFTDLFKSLSGNVPAVLKSLK